MTWKEISESEIPIKILSEFKKIMVTTTEPGGANGHGQYMPPSINYNNIKYIGDYKAIRTGSGFGMLKMFGGIKYYKNDEPYIEYNRVIEYNLDMSNWELRNEKDIPAWAIKKLNKQSYAKGNHYIYKIVGNMYYRKKR